MAASKLNPLSQVDYAIVLKLMDAATQIARGERKSALGNIEHAQRILADDLGVAQPIPGVVDIENLER